MKKKLIFIILLFIPFIVKADEKTIFTINEVTSAPGSTVTVKFNIKNNSEFGVLTARVKFDNTKLEYLSGNLNAFNSASFKGIDKNKNKGLVAIYAISISRKLKDTGDVATMEFKINDTIKENLDIPITLEIVDYGINADEALEYEVNDGIIHVNADTEITTKNTKESLKEKYKEKLKEKNKDSDDITWESSDEEIAKVDDGVVEFKKDGNVTVEARDKDGNVVYSKDYYVKGKNNKKKNNFKYIIIFSVVIILILAIVLFRRNKWKRKRINK